MFACLQVWHALDGAAICLDIFTADGLSPLLVQEDVLNSCVDLLRFHIAHNVLTKKAAAGAANAEGMWLPAPL